MPAIRPIHQGRRRSPGKRSPARTLGLLAIVAVLALIGGAAAMAGGDRPNVYHQSNLVSDIGGVARVTDHNLVNPWGLAASPTSPLWVNDNGTDLSTLYTGGVRGSKPVVLTLAVSIPGGAPTGIVFNPTSGFKLHSGTAAHFIFDSEAGRITAWAAETSAETEFTSPNGAIYKGLAIATTSHGTFLYAADFHNARIQVFNDSFADVTPAGAFHDPQIPAGYAPFNVQEIGGSLYVSYAKQDADAKDDVAGAGFGFVDVYDSAGHLLKHLIAQGNLNAPWGLVIAPRRFDAFSGDLLVGNFGDGMINAYDPSTGAFRGQLLNEDGNPIQISDSSSTVTAASTVIKSAMTTKIVTRRLQ